MAFLDEIATRVATAIGGTVGTNVFKGSMPNDPDACVAVYEYGGRAADHGFGVVTKVQHEHPAVQVLVRGIADDYSTPRTTAETIRNSLAQVQATTLSGVFYLLITPAQSPFLFKRDENERVYIACNYNCDKEPS
jgi:hypothetical protein